MSQKSIFLNGLGLVVISSGTLAGQNMAPVFSTIDKNADGTISVTEARQVKGLVEIFSRFDTSAPVSSVSGIAIILLEGLAIRLPESDAMCCALIRINPCLEAQFCPAVQ